MRTKSFIALAIVATLLVNSLAPVDAVSRQSRAGNGGNGGAGGNGGNSNGSGNAGNGGNGGAGGNGGNSWNGGDAGNGGNGGAGGNGGNSNGSGDAGNGGNGGAGGNGGNSWNNGGDAGNGGDGGAGGNGGNSNGGGNAGNGGNGGAGGNGGDSINPNLNLCPLQGRSVNVKSQIESFGKGITSNEVQLRNLIAQAANQNQNGWSSATQSYTNFVNLLKTFLKVNTDSIVQENQLKSGAVSFSSNQCNILSSNFQPSFVQSTCVNRFSSIQVQLVNFARAARGQDIVTAMYWMVSTLDSMPSICSSCTNQNFVIPLNKGTGSQNTCLAKIKGCAQAIQTATNNNNALFSQNVINNLINQWIPQVVLYCLATNN